MQEDVRQRAFLLLLLSRKDFLIRASTSKSGPAALGVHWKEHPWPPTPSGPTRKALVEPGQIFHGADQTHRATGQPNGDDLFPYQGHPFVWPTSRGRGLWPLSSSCHSGAGIKSRSLIQSSRSSADLGRITRGRTLELGCQCSRLDPGNAAA